MQNILSESAVFYTVEHLMRVAAPALSYEVRVEGTEYPTAVVVETRQLSIRFPILPPEKWPSLLSGNLPVSRIPSFDQVISVPVFLEDGLTLFQWEDRMLNIHADFITLSFLLLSRGEEFLIDQRDEYGRFRYAWSLSRLYQLIDFPVVDEWAMLVRQELYRAYPPQELGHNQPSLTPTHDIDTARRFPSLYAAARTILGGDLLRYSSPKMAMDSLGLYLNSRKKPELDPELLGAEALLETSRKHGLCSEFYFMAPEPGSEDYTYDVTSPAVRAFAKKAMSAGMVCGFHPSRATPTSLVEFQTEQGRVEQCLGKRPDCGRQHFLCFDGAKTPSIWEASGIRGDSTLGFADREGFRCGTCISYPLYDLEQDRPLAVMERPLIAMDCTLKDYRGLTKEEAIASMKGLFQRCCAVGGDFVLLWHNGTVMRNWAEWYREVYCTFLSWAGAQLRKETMSDDQ